MDLHERTLPERIRTIRRLVREAEEALILAQRLQEEIARIRAWEPNLKASQVGYSIGICLGDAEIVANRLAGLRNELQRLREALEHRAAPGNRPSAWEE